MPNHDFTLHRRHGAAGGLVKRQRTPLTVDTAEADAATPVDRATVDKADAATTTERTTARAPLRTTEEVSAVEPTTTTARTPIRATSTTPVTTRAPLTTTSVASRAPLTSTSSTSTSTSTRSTSTPLTPTTVATSSSPSSIVPETTGVSDAANGSSKSNGSSSNTGAIAGGVVVAVLVVLAILGFFLYRWKKNRRTEVDENAAIFPYGGGPNSASGNDKLNQSSFSNKRQSGYHQQVDSYDDLAGAAGGAAAGYGEKGVNEYHHPGPNDSEKYPETAAPYGMAGYGSMAGSDGREHQMGCPQTYPDDHNNNVAGRGSYSVSNAHLLGRDPSGNLSPLQPGSFLTSPNFSAAGSPIQSGRFSNLSAGGGQFNGPDYAGQLAYPPVPGSGLQAAMMNHAPNASNDTDYLPSHQDQALSAAFAAAHPESASLANRRKSSRVSVPAAAFATAGMAPLPGAPSPNPDEQQQQQQQQQAGPFEDPQYEGKLFTVTRVFEPSMPDELVISPGDTIQIVMAYDDGWCLGVNLTSSQRNGGAEPARGVFPRDCVEELPANPVPVPQGQTPIPRNVHETIREEDEDEAPVVAGQSGGANLQRAPTLPPLDMGANNRFSIGGASTKAASKRGSVAITPAALKSSTSAGTLNNRQSLTVPANVALPASEHGGSDTEDVGDDAYGGFATTPSPMQASFPPNIQVSNAASAGEAGNSQDSAANHRASNRLSTVSEGNRRLLDEFPSTPRTAASPNMPGSEVTTASPSPAVQTFGQDAAGSNPQRLSVAGSVAGSASASIRSAQNLKRTSSLIASKDAETFLSLNHSNRNSLVDTVQHGQQ